MSTHYETLGVSEDAGADEIKRAYRQLAMQWHPDKNPGNDAANEKFKSINEAYEILGNEQKRQEYDAQRKGGSSWQGHSHAFHGSMEDIFSQIFGGQGFPGFNFNMPPRNRDIGLTMAISLEDAFYGKQVPIGFSTSSGRRVDISVSIPPGIESGTRIRYQGQGDHTVTQAPPGDLYITIDIADHAKFVRNGHNLETDLPVDAISCILGFQKEISGIDGKKLKVSIPAGTQHGTRLRIGGAGMPNRSHPNKRGDMLLIVNILIPTNLSPEILKDLNHVQQVRGLDNNQQ